MERWRTEPRFSWPGDDAWYSDTGNWLFGGVVIGLVTCTLHSRFNKSHYLSFSVFLVVLVLYPLSAPCRDSSGCGYDGGVAAFPEIIFGLGGLVDATGYLGTLLYASSCVCLVHWVYTISFICRSDDGAGRQ